VVILPYAVGSLVTSGLGVALAARAGRALLITGSLTLAVSQGLLWQVVRGGDDPGYWSLALPLFVGGLGPFVGDGVADYLVLQRAHSAKSSRW